MLGICFLSSRSSGCQAEEGKSAYLHHNRDSDAEDDNRKRNIDVKEDDTNIEPSIASNSQQQALTHFPPPTSSSR